MSVVTRPVMRYHGGKWRLAPWIIQHMPAHRIYVEPFGGAASVLLRKPRSYAEVYNDLDGEIVNLFRVLRSPDAGRLVDLVELTPFAREEFELSYEPSDDPVEQARRTLVRAGMGFGSTATTTRSRTGFRGSATRTGTHPAGDWAGQPANLRQVIERLRGVVIEHRDAREVIAYHDGPQTLHYVDPPYAHDTRSWFRTNSKEAYRHEMTDDDHRELAGVLHSLQGMVIISGYPCALYDELYSDWQRVERNAMADKARPRTEVLWISPSCERALYPMLAEVSP